MTPYQCYLLYQAERPKSAAEIRLADERAGRIAAAAAGMLRAVRHPRTALGRTVTYRRAQPACLGDKMTRTMEI